MCVEYGGFMEDKILQQSFVSYAQRFLYPTQILKLISYAVILALLGIGTAMVYYTGGTHLAYLHLFYLPIILAGIMYSVPGGILIALASSVILGPWMPSNIELDLTQPLSSWILRAIFFCGVGVLSGIGSSIFRSYINELEEKFTTDPLTRLPNIGGLIKIFNEKVLENNKAYHIVLLEIFYMDEIDQAFGPHGKANLLRQMKDRLKKSLSSKVDVGFIDNKNFCLMMPADVDLHTLLPECKKELAQSYMIDNIPLFAEIHYGISRYPDDSEDLDTLIRKAKIAVVRSEQQGRDQAFFDHEESNRIQKNIKILHSLRQSIENQLMGVHYQPKVDLLTNRSIGFEALARWSHPTLGRVRPDEFIPLTERTLLINPFTEWILDEALKQAKNWHAKGFQQSIAVNFSMKNFHDCTIVNVVLDALKKYNFPPEYLEIEITESAIADNISVVADLMHTLRENGIKVAIDDFGTGQSSLQYLFKLPLDILKIDRAFVSEMNSNSGASAIVRSAITLGHELNLKVVAEGVETQKELETLKKMGCDLIQGYFMAPPMEIHEATDWLYTNLSARPPTSKVKATVP